MDFAARRVRLGARPEVALIPHWDEFDQEALFLNALGYETPVFRWLEENVAASYDLILEIGANAGLYTVFFDALWKNSPAPEGRSRRIVSFEPSPEAYRRLVANVAANHARHVTPYQAAIGETSGLQAFYEPIGHLTNGSLLREFSNIFSDTVDETVAVVLAAPELGRWLGVEGRTLIEIDVEGFEPELLTALGPPLERHRPDLLIEVLPFTLDALNAHPVLAAYDRHLRTPAGLEQSAAFHACSQQRDWLLRWPAR